MAIWGNWGSVTGEPGTGFRRIFPLRARGWRHDWCDSSTRGRRQTVPVRKAAVPRHWHFVLWPAQDDQLSDYMQQMTTTHERRWQKAHRSEGPGHGYQGRFKAFPLRHDGRFHTVCRYLDRNAVQRECQRHRHTSGCPRPRTTEKGSCRGHVIFATQASVDSRESTQVCLLATANVPVPITSTPGASRGHS